REELLRAALERALGGPVGELRFIPVAGGAINEARALQARGERFFVKWNERPLPRQFEAEARGLEAVRAAVPSLRVPRPLGFSDDGPGRSFLLLEHIERSVPRGDFEERLGRGLAELHQATSGQGFGFALDGYCGATVQPNG